MLVVANITAEKMNCHVQTKIAKIFQLSVVNLIKHRAERLG